MDPPEAASLDPIVLSPEILSTPPAMRRGPMYSAYAELRDLRLRARLLSSEDDLLLTPPHKNKPSSPSPASCHSVPAAAARKENRRPTAPLLPLPPRSIPTSKTPPAQMPAAKNQLRRSVTLSGGKKVDMDARRSYSCLRELYSAEEKEPKGRCGGGGGGRAKTTAQSRRADE